MWGIRVKKIYWLSPKIGTAEFFFLSKKPDYPFRTKEGAEHIIIDWFRKEYIETTDIEVVSNS